jgi:hypothetical protein
MEIGNRGKKAAFLSIGLKFSTESKILGPQNQLRTMRIRAQVDPRRRTVSCRIAH